MTEHKDQQLVLSGDDLEELAASFKNKVDISDRKYGFPSKLYEKCFVGTEAVHVLMDEGMATDVEDAVRIGNIMLEAGVFHHVQRAHAFKNEYLFYRFASDEDHGGLAQPGEEGAMVKWADFLGKLGCPPGEECLQPEIPGPDAELGDMAQDDLTKIGVTPLDEHNATLLDNVHPKKWVDPDPSEPYNLVVVGAGAGGLITAAGAAGIGARVAIIESHMLGGDCGVCAVQSAAALRQGRRLGARRGRVWRPYRRRGVGRFWPGDGASA